MLRGELLLDGAGKICIGRSRAERAGEIITLHARPPLDVPGLTAISG